MIMYSRITSAIPETIAENRKTIGIRTELHHGVALIDSKMKATYPWRRDEAEHPRAGARLGGQEDLVGAERVPQVRHERQRCDEKEGERGKEGKPVEGLDIFHVEDLDDGGEDETPRP